VPVDDNLPQVVVTPFVFNVPLVKVKALVPILKVSCKVHPPLTPLKFISEANVFPPNVIVFPIDVALNVIVPV